MDDLIPVALFIVVTVISVLGNVWKKFSGNEPGPAELDDEDDEPIATAPRPVYRDDIPVARPKGTPPSMQRMQETVPSKERMAQTAPSKERMAQTAPSMERMAQTPESMQRMAEAPPSMPRQAPAMPRETLPQAPSMPKRRAEGPLVATLRQRAEEVRRQLEQAFEVTIEKPKPKAPQPRAPQSVSREAQGEGPAARPAHRAAPPQVAAAAPRRKKARAEGLFSCTDAVRRGIIMAEVLGPPKAFR